MFSIFTKLFRQGWGLACILMVDQWPNMREALGLSLSIKKFILSLQLIVVHFHHSKKKPILIIRSHSSFLSFSCFWKPLL
jgi:hypothetical protein